MENVEDAAVEVGGFLGSGASGFEELFGVLARKVFDFMDIDAGKVFANGFPMPGMVTSSFMALF